jgi:hypothetical protein
MEHWFAVRHVVRNGRAFEERITLWSADSFNAAIETARREAERYAKLDASWVLLDLFQAYEVGDDEFADGSEVFSLIRESDLEPDEYIERFFATGTELEGSTDD